MRAITREVMRVDALARDGLQLRRPRTSCGAISASGTSTKARSRIRGCGTCSRGLSMRALPYSSRSRSSVRGALR